PWRELIVDLCGRDEEQWRRALYSRAVSNCHAGPRQRGWQRNRSRLFGGVGQSVAKSGDNRLNCELSPAEAGGPSARCRAGRKITDEHSAAKRSGKEVRPDSGERSNPQIG